MVHGSIVSVGITFSTCRRFPVEVPRDPPPSLHGAVPVACRWLSGEASQLPSTEERLPNWAPARGATRGCAAGGGAPCTAWGWCGSLGDEFAFLASPSAVTCIHEVLIGRSWRVAMVDPYPVTRHETGTHAAPTSTSGTASPDCRETARCGAREVWQGRPNCSPRQVVSKYGTETGHVGGSPTPAVRGLSRRATPRVREIPRHRRGHAGAVPAIACGGCPVPAPKPHPVDRGRPLLLRDSLQIPLKDPAPGGFSGGGVLNPLDPPPNKKGDLHLIHGS